MRSNVFNFLFMIVVSVITLSVSTKASAQTGGYQLEYPVVEPSQNAYLEYSCHLQGFGDTPFYIQPQACGTTGQSRRLEGFTVRRAAGSENIGIRYMAHIAGVGDTGWKFLNTYVGTKGKGKAIEGFAIQLTGASARKYDVYYMAHLAGTGDTGWYKNGEFCGTRGQGRKVEAIAIFIAEKQ